MSSPSSASSASILALPVFLSASNEEITEKFIDLEWRQRYRLAQGSRMSDPASAWHCLSGKHILERDRYADVRPWASNRIKLSVPSGQSDYINASSIDMKYTKTKTLRRFIATQGPKQNSQDHFWQMVWDETGDVGVIVMLTQTHEAGREKCFAYYPQGEPGTVLEIGEIVSDNSEKSGDEIEDNINTRPCFQATVEIQSTSFRHDLRSTERRMLLHVGTQTKPIIHLEFSSWPDWGIPEGEDRSALLELVKHSASQAGPHSKARIIHCSAGVGRTGTFIALDYLLSELSDGSLDLDTGKDYIVDCVDALRKQRMMMVQSDSQFALLYAILKEQWLERHGRNADAELQKKTVES